MLKKPSLACLGAVFLWLCALLPSASVAGEGFDVKPPPRGTTVPAVLGTDLSGRVWNSSDLRGRAVLLNFWASWCEPCRAEMPSLHALQVRHGDALVVLAINHKESPQHVQRFVQRQGWTIPVITDPQGAQAGRWGIGVFPSSVLINAAGQPVALVRGEVDWASLSPPPAWMKQWLDSPTGNRARN